MRRSRAHYVLNALLRLFAASFSHRPRLRRHLYSDGGPISFSMGVRTEGWSAEGGLIFASGSVKARARLPDEPDVVLVLAGDDVIDEVLRATPNEVLTLLLHNRMRTEGNLSYLSLFNFYLSLLLGGRHRKMMEKRKLAAREEARRLADRMEEDLGGPAEASRQAARKPTPVPERRSHSTRLQAASRDPNVVHLKDPYLSRYGLEDFPRLRLMLDAHFATPPSLSAERARLVTEWHKENGFEVTKDGRPWHPVLRQGHLLAHLLRNKRPLIGKDDLIAGTTTDETIGVVLYPDAHGTLIWGELGSLPDRELNPYRVAPETADILHHEVFPYWVDRNFREWVRRRHRSPLCQQLDERFAVYFIWKTAALSHTIPDFASILRLGARGIIERCHAELARLETGRPESPAQEKDGSRPPESPGAGREEAMVTLEAMAASLSGLIDYAQNLAEEALRQAGRGNDPGRRSELEELAAVCRCVPEEPATTLAEAVNAIWIVWVALHMESTNAGLSLGRLDQILQPYFEADMAALRDEKERETYVARAIELIGCFYMRCTDHLPLIPDIGNHLFGGSSSDQAITLGGVTPEGDDAVNDMTYVFLKVTEMLGIRDPNVNARYHPKVNSETYLRRLCEVNLITRATPSLHNDEAVSLSLAPYGYPDEHIRDWAATGCVEPTLSGRHLGHTNCMMMNLVAALEMAMNDGRHPLMRWSVGPRTGRVTEGAFPSFDAFFDAFAAQLRFLVDRAVEYNNMLGEAHALMRPTPLLSALVRGCEESGRDITRGGAMYNSSGAACIGLADVTDSLLAIEKLIFEEAAVSFDHLARAVSRNFESEEALQAMIRTRVPLFGSGEPRAVRMARRVARLAHELFANHRNYRGGPYTAGFWSMSNHVAFGSLTGALPSGRRAGKAFTPGLTPQPPASRSLLDNLRDVAALDPRHMSNNVAFNVKLVPSASDSHEKAVDVMKAYVGTYFDLGGMQMQMNVVDSAVLRDAMRNPEQHRHLLVRISGYNAYFTTLNRDMQIELIERAEYGAA